MREPAGHARLTDLSACSKIIVKGPDSRKFLQGLTTNDVLALKPFQGQRSCLLTPKGKLQADFALYRLAEELHILCWPRAGENFKAAIAKMILLSESKMEDVSCRYALFHLSGSGAFAAAGAIFAGLSPFETYQAQEASWAGEKILLLGYPLLSGDGILALVPGENGPALRGGLSQVGFEAADWNYLDALRVERGVPLFGLDMDEDTIPLEAGLEEAISFTKGCYMGQETISRIRHMGHVNRLLRRLKLTGEALPAPGSPVLSGDQEIGRTSSAVFSPRHGAPLVLAMLRIAESGARDQLYVAVKGQMVAAEIL